MGPGSRGLRKKERRLAKFLSCFFGIEIEVVRIFSDAVENSGGGRLGRIEWELISKCFIFKNAGSVSDTFFYMIKESDPFEFLLQRENRNKIVPSLTKK